MSRAGISRCVVCGQHLMSDGLTVTEGIASSAVRSVINPNRKHRCPPKWEALIGDDAIKCRAWDDLAHIGFGGFVEGVVEQIVREWHEGDGECCLVQRHNSNTVEVLVRCVDTPEQEFLFLVEADPSIHYRVLPITRQDPSPPPTIEQ